MTLVADRLVHRSALPGSSFLGVGLLAAYNLNEASGQATDSGGSGLHLTDNNTVGTRAGKVGTARDFVSASNEFFSRAGTTFRFESGGAPSDFTISCWVYPTNIAGGGAITGRAVMRCTTSATANIGDWYLSVPNTNKIGIAHFTLAGVQDTTGFHVTSGSGLLSLNTWQHVVARRLAGTYSIWLNGVSLALAAGINTQSGWGNVGFEMGRLFGAETLCWSGGIDAVQIFNVGKADGQIAALYNGGAGREAPF